MRILGLERDNGTLLSEPDYHGHRYSVSFELFPFYEGRNLTHYKGILNGDGPRNGDFGVLKTFRNIVGEAADWLNYRKRALVVRRLTVDFNRLLGYRAITCEVPVLVKLDTVSDFIRPFRWFYPHTKHLQQGEFAVFEDLFEEDLKFQNFGLPSPQTVSGYGVSEGGGHANPSSDSPAQHGPAHPDDTEQTADTRLLLEAFVHYSWVKSRQSRVVCDFQGVREEISPGRHIIRLSNPTVHSIEREFGETDSGVQAVRALMEEHQCNQHCQLFRAAHQRNVPSYLFTGCNRG